MQRVLVRSISARKGKKNRIHGPACERGLRTATTPPCGRRAQARSAAHAPAVVPERDGAIRSIKPAWKPAPAHIAGLASARAPAKGTMLKNVRQTLRMAAITGVLASAPLTLSNAIASADYERVTRTCRPRRSSRPGLCRRRTLRPPTTRPAPDAAARSGRCAGPGRCRRPRPTCRRPRTRRRPHPMRRRLRPPMHRRAPAPDAPPLRTRSSARTGGARARRRRARRRSRPGAREQGLQRQLGRDRCRASRVATGASAPVTATPAVCSSRRAPGAPTVARGPRTARAVRSRSGWPRTCCTRRASARGRSAAVAADQAIAN